VTQYIFGKPLGSTSIICKKWQICKNQNNYCEKCANKKIAQLATNYTFLKIHRPSGCKYAKRSANILNPISVFKKN